MSIDIPSHARALRSTRFAGPVIAPGEPDWDGARQAFNLAVDQRPALVAVAQDAGDVAQAVRFAAEHGLRVAPQATGHNAAPLGDLSASILLKTSAMRGFDVDLRLRRARVEAGMKWGPVCDAVSAHGLAPLSGSARDVGVVGYSLGGGIGWLARKHGLQCNAVTAIELVAADGRQLRVDQEHEPELFWALRGGGGSFGVVTAIEFDLFPVEQLYAGTLFFPFERASQVVHAWREWGEGLPDEVMTTVKLLQLPPLPEIPEPLRGNSFAIVQAAVLGGEAFGCDVMAPLRALGPAVDTFGTIEPVGLTHLAMDPEHPLPYDGDGRIYGDLPADGLDRFLAGVGPGSGSPLVSAELRLAGGALGRCHDDHGVADMLVGSYLSFLAGGALDAEMATAVRDRIDTVNRSMAMYEAGQYMNFAESPTEAERFHGERRTARLRELRSQWDPHKVLHANHAL